MIRINLLKPETKDIREQVVATGGPELTEKKAPNLGNLIFLLLVIGLGAFYFLQQKAFDKENTLLAAAKQEKAKLATVEARLEEQKRIRESLDRKITLIESLNAQRDLTPRLMDEFSRRLPEWVWLTEVVYDAKGIQIKGKALSNNLIADYIASLESSPQIMNVNLISSTQRTAQRDEFLEFSLRAQIEKKPDPVPAAAPEPATKPAAKQGRTT